MHRFILISVILIFLSIPYEEIFEILLPPREEDWTGIDKSIAIFAPFLAVIDTSKRMALGLMTFVAFVTVVGAFVMLHFISSFVLSSHRWYEWQTFAITTSGTFVLYYFRWSTLALLCMYVLSECI